MANHASCLGFKCAQVTLISLNMLYAIVGCVLIIIAAVGKVEADIVEFHIMGGIIACGVFLLVIAIAGLIGTCLHHQVTLFFYMSILFLLFLVQFVVACACLALNEGARTGLIRTVWNETGVSHETFQSIFDCCGGADNTEACLRDDGIRNCSNVNCCHGSLAPCCTGKWPAQTNVSLSGNAMASNESTVYYLSTTAEPSKCPCEACWPKVDRIVSKSIKAAGGVGFFFSFTELIGVWLAFRFRNLKNPYADPHQFL